MESICSLFNRVLVYIDTQMTFQQWLKGKFWNHHQGDPIPTVIHSFQECTRYITPIAMDAFLDGQIRSRISIRLIAEQHIALSRTLADPQSIPGEHVGVIDMKCSPQSVIRECETFVGDLCLDTLGVKPEVVLDGDVDATFP